MAQTTYIIKNVKLVPSMNIHVVQQGETINSIAEIYGVSPTRLIQENEINYPDKLVPGQTIVITHPQKTYAVKVGDSLAGIADLNDITLMQLLRNNPFLQERDYIYPDETLVISYEHERTLTTIGYALPFINQIILRKTLPYLTYLFVYNYRITRDGEAIAFYDDSTIIHTAKAYGVAPIMLVTTLTAQGIQNVQTAYEILINENIQEKIIDNILRILESKGYYGLNMSFLYLTESNEALYNKFTEKISKRLTSNGYRVFVTIDPNLNAADDEISFAKINYSVIGTEINSISFISYVWGTNIKPPSPVSSIANMKFFLDYVSTMIPSDKITAGIQIIAYDWEIPFVAGYSKGTSLSVDEAINLARIVGAVIQFDELSQTPYYEYAIKESGKVNQHAVWFMDARTVNSLVDMITTNKYKGPSIWNIMNYYPQLWLIINSQYDIEKIL